MQIKVLVEEKLSVKNGKQKENEIFLLLEQFHPFENKVPFKISFTSLEHGWLKML